MDDIVSLAVSAMPDIALGCDMMAGFPGESQKDFTDSVNLLRRCRFSSVHAFPYSERPGTPAAAFPSPVPGVLRSSRAKHLARIAENERVNFARRFIGRNVNVLVENEKKCAGWTSEHLWFEVRRPGGVLPKRREIAAFRATEAKDGILRGQFVKTI